MNTVVNAYNVDEDMTSRVLELNPVRWKVNAYSPLCTSITPCLFHSRLKTYLFHKSCPLSFTFSPGLPPRTSACTVSFELLVILFFFFHYFSFLGRALD